MKTNLVCLMFVLLASQAIAQRKVERGYIVTADSSVVHGYIAIKTSYRYTDHILFQTTAEADFVKYTPEEIKGYVIEPGRRYESIAENNVYRFYQYLAQGRLNLLQLEEPGETLFFLHSDQAPLTLLYYKEELINDRYLLKNEFYKETLREEMADCPEALSSIDKIRLYGAKSLTEVFTKYNRCFYSSNSYPVADKLRKPVSIYSGIQSGKALSTPSFLLAGVNLDIAGRNKVVFGTFFWQKGWLRKEFGIGTQSHAVIRNRMTELGVKLNVLVISLTDVEPYVFGSFSYLRYKDDVNDEPVNRLSALSFGSGVGLRFNLSAKVFLKTEFGLHFIPGKNYLSDLTIFMDTQKGEIRPTALRRLGISLSYKLTAGG